MTTPAPWRIDMGLPPTWFSLTCDIGVDREDVPEQVAERIARQPELAPSRVGLIQTLLDWSATAADLGAVCAAMRWDRDATFGVGVATFVAQLDERDPGPVDTELSRLGVLVARRHPDDEYPPRVAEVELATGRAVRMEAVRQPPAEEDGRTHPLQLIVRYWVPLAGTSTTLELNFSTDNLALAAPLTAEFDLIAAGFELSPA